ncbi:Leucine Rich repeats (2 copies) [Carpediemonas membranifera]|uniref:Leucine Rich repeats (2 copies) n=1 Tax=Carpediemonas membranifera TaxID=201153 RepID=A0A8J6E0B1_9EUKA|nr:Leucine Rich repeats (2 copies) [Carpediemonas membranifera]|eukprot:KAG9394854.1 Leucine Rich repeats (2 copies) [Carpediemonas membranifera]
MDLGMLESPAPSRMRMRQIADKLGSLQAGLEDEKQARRDAIEMKLRVLEEKLSKSTAAEETKMNSIKDAISRLLEEITQAKGVRESLDDRKTKELRQVESSVTYDLSTEKSTRKDGEGKILKAIDDRCFALRLELAKDKKAREESEESQTKKVNEEIGRLNELLETEHHDRTERYARMAKKLEDEVAALNETLATERKVREESEQTMFKMLEDVATRIQSDIAQEREDREGTEETLLRLLENTCSNVEAMRHPEDQRYLVVLLPAAPSATPNPLPPDIPQTKLSDRWLADPPMFSDDENEGLNVEQMMDDLLSLEKLQQITGKTDLSAVTTLSTMMNANMMTMSAVGDMLPNLEKLSMSRSIIYSVSSLGSSFNSLTHLYIDRCHTKDLDGVEFLPNLTHLLASENEIEDLQPICMCNSLTLLDLRSNRIADPETLTFLTMPPLKHVALANNPIQASLGDRYEQTVQDNIPADCHIDTLPFDELFLRQTRGAPRRPLTSARSMRVEDPREAPSSSLTQQQTMIVGSPARSLKAMRRAAQTPRTVTVTPTPNQPPPRIMTSPGPKPSGRPTRLDIKPPVGPFGVVGSAHTASPLARGRARMLADQ